MPVQYIGRKTFYHGKTLYSIARNFKNFGVGRMVQRYNFFRYEEPSYYILTKVEPDMTCPVSIRHQSCVTTPHLSKRKRGGGGGGGGGRGDFQI